MLNQIKKDLRHPFGPVKRRFKDGRIVFFYNTINVFNDIPKDVINTLERVAKKYDGWVNSFMATLSIDPLKQSFDCNLTVKQLMSLNDGTPKVLNYLAQFCKVHYPYEGTRYVVYKGWCFFEEHYMDNPSYGCSKDKDY